MILLIFITFLFSIVNTKLYKKDNDVSILKYCIIGAGPAGLQLGSFFERSSRNYMIFESSTIPGNFFSSFPRHKTLISINKRFTGHDNTEFNLRHDWNSLLTPNKSLRFTKYSTNFFPSNQEYLRYLQDFHKYEKVKVKFSTRIDNVVRRNKVLTLIDQNGAAYKCSVLVLATGLQVPHDPITIGRELVTGYEDMQLDPHQYRDKDVAIIGGGNAAFEVAQSILPEVRSLTLISKRMVRLAYNTHYVGDLRAINFNVLDSFRFSMLTSIVHLKTGIDTIVKMGNKLYLPQLSSSGHSRRPPLFDVVVRCTGWRFNWTLLKSLDKDFQYSQRKYPNMRPNYMSEDVEDMYYIGAVSHAVDSEKSSGGFIHGFRYTTRSLYKIFEWKYEGQKWTDTCFDIIDLLDHVLSRINEGSGNYQMFLVLGDVFVIDKKKGCYSIVEEYPLLELGNFATNTGLGSEDGLEFIVSRFEYNPKFSGVGVNTLSNNRVRGSSENPQFSNFLHPVLYSYSKFPSPNNDSSTNKERLVYLNSSNSIHHSVEDLRTDFSKIRNSYLPMFHFFLGSHNLNFLIMTNEQSLLKLMSAEIAF